MQIAQLTPRGTFDIGRHLAPRPTLRQEMRHLFNRPPLPRHAPGARSARPVARVQPGPRRAYANGPGSSTRRVPSGSTVLPRVAVSWRSPEPSGRMAKIWSPNGLPPTGSQLDPNSMVPVTLSGTTPTSRSIVHT